VGIKRKFKVKVNNTNDELFDGLFKQDLGNASSPVPPGAWEGISSSLGSGASIAGAAANTAIWMKAAISAVVIIAASAVVYQYNRGTEEQTKMPNQVPTVSADSKSEQGNGLTLNVDLNQNEQNDPKESDNFKPIDHVKLDDHVDYIQDMYDFEMPPPNVENDFNKEGFDEKQENHTISSKDESTQTFSEEPEPVFFTEASIKDSSYIEVPDAFTNDGDGINDTYQIKLIGEERVEIIIYTADNQIIFRTKNKYTAWDSRMPNGELAPEGFYFVKVIYKYKNQVESTPIIRRITLIR
jgi:gliding motility-associated-like protein